MKEYKIYGISFLCQDAKTNHAVFVFGVLYVLFYLTEDV